MRKPLGGIGNLEPRFLSVDGAVIYSGLPRTQILDLVAQGVLTHKRNAAPDPHYFTRGGKGRKAGAILICKQSLDGFLDSLPAYGGATAAGGSHA